METKTRLEKLIIKRQQLKEIWLTELDEELSNDIWKLLGQYQEQILIEIKKQKE